MSREGSHGKGEGKSAQVDRRQKGPAKENGNTSVQKRPGLTYWILIGEKRTKIEYEQFVKRAQTVLQGLADSPEEGRLSRNSNIGVKSSL